MEFNRKTLRNIFFGVISCIILYWILHDTSRVKNMVDSLLNVFGPFIVGAGIAFVLNVPMRAIENALRPIANQSARRTLASVLSIVLLLTVVAVVIWMLIPQLADTISTLIPQLESFWVKLKNDSIQFVNEHPELTKYINISDIMNMDWSTFIQKIIDFISTSISTILSSAITVITTVTTGLVNAFISIVFAVYCLFQKETLARQGRRLAYAFLEEKKADYIIRTLRLANSTFSNFLSGQCIEVVILGGLFAVAMAIFRMPYIPLVSVLVAITAFIPVVGAWVGCILGAFFILVANPVQALWFVALFVVIQQIENHMIYPRVVGTSIGLSGMWVLVAVSVGGAVMGVAGMFLMIPMASVLYTLLGEYTNKRVTAKGIDSQKLQEHPPAIKSKYKEKIERKKAAKKTKEEISGEKQ